MRAGLAAIVELGPERARCASARATTAASSAGTTIISRISSREFFDAFRCARRRPSGSICRHLIPQNLAGKTVAEIERIELGTTRMRVTAGDVFRIREGDPDAIVIEGGSARFDRVGIGHGLRLDPRRRGSRRRSRAPDVGRTIDHSRRRGPVRGLRNEGRNAGHRRRRGRAARRPVERRDGRHERRRPCMCAATRASAPATG